MTSSTLRYRLALIIAICSGGLAVRAQSPQELAAAAAKIPVEAFFNNANIRMPRLSPDGSKVAYLRKQEDRFALALFDRESSQHEIITPSRVSNPRDFFWKGDEHLVYFASPPESYHTVVTREVTSTSSAFFGEILNIDGSWRKKLRLRHLGLRIVDELHDDSERVLIFDGMLRYSNLFSNERPVIFDGTLQRQRFFYRDPVVDSDGQLRFVNRVDLRRGLSEFLYREHNGDDWTLIVDEPANPMRPGVAIMWMSQDQNAAYIVSRHEYDRGALYEFDLKNRWLGDVIFRPPEGEITALLHSRGNERMLGAVYMGDKENLVWFDDERKALQQKLEEEYPNADVRMVDSSIDEQVMLVTATSDRFPGSVSILDRRVDDRLKEFKRSRPRLHSHLMRPQQIVRYPSFDGYEIQAYLTLPHAHYAGDRVPLVVLTHRDHFVGRWYWEFNPTVQFLASRGYAVLQINHRGSTGFGHDFVELGRFQLGKGILEDLIAGVDWTVAEGMVDPDRVAIMGGYHALAGLTLRPDRFACGVNISGRADLEIAYREPREGTRERKGEWDFRDLWIGRNREERAKVSPVENIHRISAPSFHYYERGDPDMREEHAARLRRELRKHAKLYQFHTVKIPDRLDEIEAAEIERYRMVETFLAENL